MAEAMDYDLEMTSKDSYPRKSHSHRQTKRNKQISHAPLEPIGIDSITPITSQIAAKLAPVKGDIGGMSGVVPKGPQPIASDLSLVTKQSQDIKPKVSTKSDYRHYPHSQARTKRKFQHEKSSDYTSVPSSKSGSRHPSKSFQDISSSESERLSPESDTSQSLDPSQAGGKSSAKYKKRYQPKHKYSHDLQQSPATHLVEQQRSLDGESIHVSGSYKSKKPKSFSTKVKSKRKQTTASKASSIDTSLDPEQTQPTKLHSGRGKPKEQTTRKPSCPESGVNEEPGVTSETFELNNATEAVSKSKPTKRKQRVCNESTSESKVESKSVHSTSKISESEETVTLESVEKKIRTKKSECIESTRKEITKLTKKLHSRSKFRNVSKLNFGETVEKHRAEKKMIKDTIDEIKNRQIVLVQHCEQISTKLIELSCTDENFQSKLDSLYSEFKREARRYDKGLPIYAHRLHILDMIQNNQVSILIGETGSGKSTQLVQYLYEAGYSSNGLIACTQPRKLAAHSLADHVSKEVDEMLGVTYDFIDSKRKLRRGSKVVFMTDYMLLNECIADQNLRKYSCLVIDEAHERSIHTDILIALIKRCLPHRPDLKVIITSATINPTLFSVYFGGENECPIISVPGRVYPVQVSWSESKSSVLEQDYVLEAVDKVYEIHVKKQKEMGDVLVFLTCPAEIERACKLAQQLLKKEAIVLPLHGKLQPEEQQKVFQSTPGKRKVIFSTNVAETSITIPGIVYVVDTGLSKELCYDPQKNMNSLEIRPISKSSADQRKGRAGRTCPGECYRLFTEEDYKNMNVNSVPEILRITLAFAVIKLYEFGIREIHSFEFVESPDRKALDDAIENLKFLGAINQDRLTDLGRKMAVLPLEPNLSKVLFDAVNQGIGLEAATAVSISTLAGRVFFRPDTVESQQESVKKKLPFCQPTGDQMTYLHTYFEWSKQERKDRTQWCVENFVNAKSMRMVQQIVDELRFILIKQWHIDLPPKITSLEKADELLPEIFCNAFLTNICIYLGHSAVGYWCEKLPGEQLVVYPASSLKQLNSVPQCVVYEKTHKTSQHFLLQVLPVREEWIQKAVESGKLMCHPADHPYYNLYKVEPLMFTNLGSWISVQLSHKYPQDRRITVPEFYDFDIQPVFEYSRKKGTLEIFSQQQNHDIIQTSVKEHIDSLKQQLQDENRTCGITKSNSIKMVLGLGGCVQSILKPGDFQTILVRGIRNEEQLSDVKMELSTYGNCTYDSKLNDRGIQLYAKFTNPANAADALKHQFTSFYEPNLRILKYRDQNKRNYFLKIEWCRRKRRPLAFINFSNEEQFRAIVFDAPIFTNSDPKYYDPPSMLTFSPTNERNSIKVYGSKILNGVPEDYVIARLSSFLPACKEALMSVHFLYDDEFEETNHLFSSQQTRLEKKLAQCNIPPHSYIIIFDHPQPKQVMYKAQVYFDDTRECFKMYCSLNDKQIEDSDDEFDEDSDSDSDCDSDNESESESSDDGSSGDTDEEIREPDPVQVRSGVFNVELVLTYSVRYTPKFFSAIKPNISKVKKHLSQAYSCITIDCDRRDRWGNIFVNLTASEHRAFHIAKRKLEKATEPIMVECEDTLENQYVSTAAFQVIIQEIQERTSTYIKLNESSLKMTTISIYGTQIQCEIAKRDIQAQLQSISHTGIDCIEIDLRAYSPGLMKLLVKKYGCDIEKLPETCEGIITTKLVPKKHILTVFATEDGYKSMLDLLSRLNHNTITQALKTNESEVSAPPECCVCFDNLYLKPTRPVSYYRLEYCGHAYCRECIMLQLQSNTISFPVTCAADGCEKKFVWKDFENLFKHEVVKLRDIATVSLDVYITSNPEIVHNCTTPDCKMVYFVSKQATLFVCAECKVKLCSCCHSKWHQGLSCDEYKHCDDPEYSIRKWMKEDITNRRQCPKCKNGIQKNGGCPHVTCRIGRKYICCHICWTCMAYFPTVNDYSAHYCNSLL